MVLRGCRWVIDSIDRLVDWSIGVSIGWLIGEKRTFVVVLYVLSTVQYLPHCLLHIYSGWPFPFAIICNYLVYVYPIYCDH
jgi:hypothetical protein